MRLAVKIEFLEPVRKHTFGWNRKVRVNGKDYFISVQAGRRVRIAFKPRGVGAYGFHWHARVVPAGGREIWYGEVRKSDGCKSIMERALEHDFMRSAFGDRYVNPWRDYRCHENKQKQECWQRICQAGQT